MKRKVTHSSPAQKKLKTTNSDQHTDPDPTLVTIFQGLTFYIHPANFGTGRLKIFEKQVKKFGGHLLDQLPQFCESLSHIVFEESIDTEKVKVLIEPGKFPNAVFVRCTWLSVCIKSKSRESTEGHEIKVRSEVNDTERNKPNSTLLTKHTEEGDSAEDVPLCNQKIEVVSSCNEDCTSKNLEESTLKPLNNDSDLATSSGKPGVSCVEDSYNRKKEIDQESLPSTIVEESQNPEPQTSTVDNSEISYKSKPYPKFLQDKFVCSQPSSQTKGFNSHITSELEKLATAYKSKNDTWRAVGYQKAISAIRNYPKEITSREEALNIRGIGARLADKVAEIVESGKLRKVSEICGGEEAQALQLFMGVWGAGPTTAQSWYTQGFRTLEDLHKRANLTRHQQIGLKYYDDINSRIPRDEVAEIESYVRETALSIKKGLIVTVCGSYRRGKPTCGDVDVLITHPDGQSHNNIFRPLLQKMKDLGFLTDDLVTQEDNGNQKKYLGVCILPGKNRKHRRLDVIVVPYAEFAPAIMYFTGSAHFNRSMRLLATKMGMSLSEHGLRAGVIRQGREKLTAGRLLDTPTEESIFRHLGLEYRSPQERDH